MLVDLARVDSAGEVAAVSIFYCMCVCCFRSVLHAICNFVYKLWARPSAGVTQEECHTDSFVFFVCLYNLGGFIPGWTARTNQPRSSFSRQQQITRAPATPPPLQVVGHSSPPLAPSFSVCEHDSNEWNYEITKLPLCPPTGGESSAA